MAKSESLRLGTAFAMLLFRDLCPCGWILASRGWKHANVPGRKAVAIFRSHAYLGFITSGSLDDLPTNEVSRSEGTVRECDPTMSFWIW